MTDSTNKTIMGSLGGLVRSAFISFGILPLVLVGTMIFFGSFEERFLSGHNLFNLARQTTYLAIASMGQMIVLLTAGFDLSMGSTIALTTVISAMAMAQVLAGDPNAIYLAIMIGVLAGLAVGIIVGAINGFGVAVLDVPPFMMTLGMLTAVFGVALIVTGGAPVYGIPDEFKRHFGFGRVLGIPAPILFTIGLFILLYFVINFTRMGRYFYAIGSNQRAAILSGINIRFHTLFAYIFCSSMASCTGLLLLARAGTGESTLGRNLVLEPLAACIIGGVSIWGGVGRLPQVILGAFFISVVTNGMNLIRIESYVQQIVLGVVLIAAIVVDRMRLRYMSNMSSH